MYAEISFRNETEKFYFEETICAGTVGAFELQRKMQAHKTRAE